MKQICPEAILAFHLYVWIILRHSYFSQAGSELYKSYRPNPALCCTGVLEGKWVKGAFYSSSTQQHLPNRAGFQLSAHESARRGIRLLCLLALQSPSGSWSAGKDVWLDNMCAAHSCWECKQFF